MFLERVGVFEKTAFRSRRLGDCSAGGFGPENRVGESYAAALHGNPRHSVVVVDGFGREVGKAEGSMTENV